MAPLLRPPLPGPPRPLRPPLLRPILGDIPRPPRSRLWPSIERGNSNQTEISFQTEQQNQSHCQKDSVTDMQATPVQPQYQPLSETPPLSRALAPRPPRMAPRGKPLCPIDSPLPPMAPRARGPAGRPNRAWMLLLPRRCFKLFWNKRFVRNKKVMQQSQTCNTNSTAITYQ